MLLNLIKIFVEALITFTFLFWFNYSNKYILSIPSEYYSQDTKETRDGYLIIHECSVCQHVKRHENLTLLGFAYKLKYYKNDFEGHMFLLFVLWYGLFENEQYYIESPVF